MLCSNYQAPGLYYFLVQRFANKCGYINLCGQSQTNITEKTMMKVATANKKMEPIEHYNPIYGVGRHSSPQFGQLNCLSGVG